MGTTLSASMPVARKEHWCSWCGETIRKGEKYDRWNGVHCGEFQSSALHTECAQAFRDSDWDEYYPGEQERGSTCEHGCRCELHTRPKKK